MLESVEWGEFNLGDLFELKGIKQAKSQKLIPTDDSVNGIPYVIQSMSNNMVSRNVNKQWLIENNEPPISGNKIVLGVTLPAVSYQPNEFGASQVIIAESDWLNNKNGNFIAVAISRLMSLFSYQNKPGIEKYKKLKISLPLKNREIDYDFMERFIAELEAERVAELEAYLTATGLKDYHLTLEEQKALDDLGAGKVVWGEFEFKDIFDQIKQGRRLKKDDQIPGDIPFVMSGVTDTGVVNYISNPVASFPRNSITVDIFGNAFYRSYDYGAGDDTGAYWSKIKNYSKEMMLFFTSSINQALMNKFDYGNKLRSSQSLNLKMKLPSRNNQPDLSLMETLISAVQKLVIKDVVQYADQKISAHEQVIKAS